MGWQRIYCCIAMLINTPEIPDCMMPRLLESAFQVPSEVVDGGGVDRLLHGVANGRGINC